MHEPKSFRLGSPSTMQSLYPAGSPRPQYHKSMFINALTMNHGWMIWERSDEFSHSNPFRTPKVLATAANPSILAACRPASQTCAESPTPRHRALELSVGHEITINGESRVHNVEPRTLLVHLIRDVVGLTGTHVGCETSLCGACTVLLNGDAVKSCTLLAVQADGQEITTIEGLADDGELHPVQEGFWECHGLQCGFCTPGMIMTAAQLLERNKRPTEADIRKGIEGNICRCTGYQHIIDAVQYAAKKMRA